MRRNDLLMAVLPLGAFFAPTVNAQSTQTTWGAVVFVANGESQPFLLKPLSPGLTSLGAAQVYSAGSLIRNRYLVSETPTLNNTATNIGFRDVQYDGIQGLNKNVVNNDQLTVLSTSSLKATLSANAFLQGLYPPLKTQGDTLTSMADGTMLQFPVGGYQYAAVDNPSSMDWESIWVDGKANCPSYDIAAAGFATSAVASTLKAGTSSFYQSLNTPLFAPLQQAPSGLTFTNAYNLYEYASYQYNHNASVRATLPASSLSVLRLLAGQQQFALLGNLSAKTPNSGDSTQILAVAGKTLATRALASLSAAVMSGGLSNKLNLMFGSYEPFLSFFALSGLSSGTTGQSTRFQSLPLPGSIMVFELFSASDPAAKANGTLRMPDPSDLWVRFFFRNGTDPSSSLISYPLFGRGNSESDMRWVDFKNSMNAMTANGGGDIASWCRVCASSAYFCAAFNGGSASGGAVNGGGTTTMPQSGGGISASVAGVIGAVVTLAVVLVVLLAAMFIGGLRFGLRDSGSRNTGLGGFKGAEKMKSDVDVSVVQVGPENTAPGASGSAGIIRHERVGSWELHDTPRGHSGEPQAANLDRIVSTVKYDDEDAHSVIDPFGDPVKVEDRV